MSQEYKILSVGPPREWASKQGAKFLAYPVELEGEGSVEWSRKPDSDVPKAGEMTLPATIENGPHGKKLKVDWDAVKESKGSSGRGGRSKRSEWQPEAQRDPERSARILRQHSQEMALRAIGLADEEARTPAELQELVTRWADFFDADVNQAGQAAIQGAGGSEPSSLHGSQGASLPATTPAPESQSAVSLEEAEQALDVAAILEPAKRRKIAEFVVTQLKPERAAKAVRNLTNTGDLGEQAATVKALVENTEAWIGGPLPAETKTEDEIPF